jgi:hypothetical protein
LEIEPDPAAAEHDPHQHLPAARAANDRAGRVDVDVELRDLPDRSPPAADAGGDRHLDPEDLAEHASDRVPVQLELARLHVSFPSL